MRPQQAPGVLVCFRLLALFLVLALGAPALAHDHPVPDSPAPGEREMSPEEQEMMAVWMRAMTPGEPHAWLARQSGSWSFSGSFWMEPGAEPMVSPGTVERRMILGGRVMEETVSSSFMGQPFEGLGLTGYDNVTGEYWTVWTDNMGTGVMTATGTCDPGGASCTFTGSYNDPMIGGAKPVRMTLEATEGREVFRMHEAGPDGEELMTMELVYTRAQ